MPRYRETLVILKTSFQHILAAFARAWHRARADRRLRDFAPRLLICTVVCIGGCAGISAEGPSIASISERTGAVADAAGPPPWQTGAGSAAAELPPVEPALVEPSSDNRVLFDDPGAPPVLFSQDPDTLRAEVASECLAAQSMTMQDPLGALVTSLYLSVIDPAEGTEALILGKCAPVGDIVREMVTKGGEQTRASVVERARALSAPRERGVIAKAAAEGAVRHAELNGLGTGPTRLARHHAMLYFPSGGSAMRIESTGARDRLYRQAVPGFGIYTFILVGAEIERLAETDQARHRELFRLVETYAAAGGEGDAAPRPDAHVFLLPVDTDLVGMSLFNQVAADLSDRMRLQLIKDLRSRSEASLAARMEKGAGPFLVAGIQPDLLPDGSSVYRLVADLSGIGIEHMYAVVDAFDRGISPELGGRPESLAAIRERLEDVVPKGGDQASGGGAANAGPVWLFMLGGTDEARAGAAIGRFVLGVAAIFKNEPPSA